MTRGGCARSAQPCERLPRRAVDAPAVARRAKAADLPGDDAHGQVASDPDVRFARVGLHVEHEPDTAPGRRATAERDGAHARRVGVGPDAVAPRASSCRAEAGLRRRSAPSSSKRTDMRAAAMGWHRFDADH